jgi:MOSC domain-containing protein YiiM
MEAKRPMPARLIAICIASVAAGVMRSLEEVEAVAGAGLAGDRYALSAGTFQNPSDAEPKHVTLIEQETLEAVRRDYQFEISHAMTRRNLLVEGAPLNHWVGKTFAIGDVLIRGLELCEPCRHLQKLSGPEVFKPLIHRGGLRAEIVRGGMLRVGQALVVEG